MRSKVQTEAKQVEQYNKYLYSSHKRGDFGGLVQLSELTIEAVLMPWLVRGIARILERGGQR